MVDTDGCALELHPSRQRDGAPPRLRAARSRWLFVELGLADVGYAGHRVARASFIRIEIVRKPQGQVGFAVHERRWVVEQFFAWIGRNRRLIKDFEASVASAEAFLYAGLGRCIQDSRQIQDGLSSAYMGTIRAGRMSAKRGSLAAATMRAHSSSLNAWSKVDRTASGLRSARPAASFDAPAFQDTQVDPGQCADGSEADAQMEITQEYHGKAATPKITSCMLDIRRVTQKLIFHTPLN